MSIIGSTSSTSSVHQPAVSAVSGLKKNIAEFAAGVKTKVKRVVACVTHPFASLSTAQKAIIKNIDERARKSQSFIEKLYFQELKILIAHIESGKDVEELLRQIDITAKKLEELAEFATDQTNNLLKRFRPDALEELLVSADHLYRECMNRLHDLNYLPGTGIQKAAYSGRLVTIFRDFDNALSDRIGHGTLHRYCGCHIKANGDDKGLKLLSPVIRGGVKFLVERPQRETGSNHPSAVLLSQSYGGGHNVVQHAMSQRLSERGGHAYKMEADEEVLEKYYNYRKWTGKSGSEWAQYFLQRNYFKTIRFLGWLSGGRDSKEAREGKVNCFAVPLLARGEQDLAVMCFQRNTSPAEKAASRLGMGLFEIATDIDYQVFDFEKDVENPHFKHGMMAGDSVQEERVLRRALKPNQIVESGFPVRDAFLKKYTDQELAQIRSHYRQKYKLAPDARVIILLCGGEGVSNTMAETLANKYPADGPKVHLFAVCGKNEKKQKILLEHFKTVNKPNFQATALGWTNEKELGELFALGALEKDKGLLISAKTGGGTISEAIARGIPIFACEMSGIPHERLNLDFVLERQLGKEFRSESELPKKVVEMLQTPFTPRPAPDGESYADFHSKEKSMQVLQKLVAECRADRQFQLKKMQSQAKLPPASSFAARSQALQKGASSSSDRMKKMEKLVKEYGWNELMNPSLLAKPEYTKFLEFLIDSRLIFAIRGYEASLHGVASSMNKGIQFFNGEPHLFKEGQWVSWSEIVGTFRVDRELGIVSKNSTQSWNYLYPKGLTQQTRYNWIGQVHQLSSDEMQSLYELCKTSSDAQNEKIPEKGNCAFLQIFTNGESFSDRIGGHVGVRLIDQNGKVYSIGLERRNNKNSANNIFSSLGTYNAGLASLDFREFAQFDVRRVTTKAITSETFDRLLQKAKSYTANPIRFNFLHQSCVNFATDLLRESGVQVSSQNRSGCGIVFNTMAPKFLRKIVQCAKYIFSCIPSFIRKPIEFLVTVITFIPSKIFTLFKNLVLLAFGAGKVAQPPQPNAENTLDNSQRLTSFNRLFNNWTDLFQDLPISMPYKIADWQMEQRSTQLHTYAGPKLYIVKGG